MSHDAFVTAIRANPDDDTARLVFADWYEENGQPERAEYVRAACRLARTPMADPAYPAVQRRCLELYAANYREWVGEWPEELEWSFDRGLLTGATGPLRALAEQWERIFARHPIHRVRTGGIDTPPPELTARDLAWVPQVDDLRIYWRGSDHQLFGLFDPADLRFRRLWIDGDPDPAHTLRLMDGPTRTALESFRYVYSHYPYGENARERVRVQREGFHNILTRLDEAPLRELGVLLGGDPVNPDDVRHVLGRDFAPRLELLELSAALPSKGAADLLASTDRLPALRRLAHGIDRGNRLQSLGAILNNPHLSRLAELATEWSTSSDRAIAGAPFARRAREVQLWRPIAARAPRSGVPLESARTAPEVLDVALGDDPTDGAERWLGARWAGGLRELRLRGYSSSLRFATRLAQSPGFPGLRRLTLTLEGGADARVVTNFVAAVQRSTWLPSVLVTCHLISAPGGALDGIAGIVPAAAPENPGDLAWYACPPAVERLRAFHILPE